MARVLIIEPDDDVRASLRALFDMAGYDTAEAVTIPGGLTYLNATRLPMVVLCGNDSPAHTQITSFFAQIGRESPQARRHGYICLTTTDPERLPEPLHALLDQLAVPVVPKPFSIEPLLALVDDVATRITPDIAPRRGVKRRLDRR